MIVSLCGFASWELDGRCPVVSGHSGVPPSPDRTGVAVKMDPSAWPGSEACSPCAAAKEGSFVPKVSIAKSRLDQDKEIQLGRPCDGLHRQISALFPTV